MTPLRDRPAIWLRRLMIAKGDELELVDGCGLPKPISGRALAHGTWPELDQVTAKGRVESMLAGRQTRPEHVEAISAFLGVDPGLFTQEPDVDPAAAFTVTLSGPDGVIGKAVADDGDSSLDVARAVVAALDGSAPWPDGWTR